MKNIILRTLSFFIIMSMFFGALWGIDQKAAREICPDVARAEQHEKSSFEPVAAHTWVIGAAR